MRIAYGVFGYGRGHATRALAILPELRRRHDVLVLAGGEAYSAIWPEHPVTRIPTLGYRYDARGRRSNYLTFRDNAAACIDVLFGGPVLHMVLELFRDFRPDVVLSDAEPWTHRAACRLRIPRIAFDHFGIMVHCQLPVHLLDRLRSLRDVAVYRILMGQAQRVIISSFYPAPARRPGVIQVGTLLRDAVRNTPARRGDYLLAYFNNGAHQFSPRIEAALRGCGCRTVIYGVPRQGVDDALDFRPSSDLPFVEHMAGCRAVISTAGNQLVGEALHFRKPLLVMPEDCVEQRLNAAAVERLGIGWRSTFDTLDAQRIRDFLRHEEQFIAAMDPWRGDAREAALRAIDRCARELASSARPARLARLA